MNAIIKNINIDFLVSEYEEKLASLQNKMDELEEAYKALRGGTMVFGTYQGSSIDFLRMPHKSVLEYDLKKSAWKAVYNAAKIDYIASANDKKNFNTMLESDQLPAFTKENAIATFGDYLVNARYHILKGLAEAFSNLDPSYRSHSKVKIGVKGLPKRIILSNMEWLSGYSADKFLDVVNALASYQNIPHMTHSEMQVIYAARKTKEDAVFDGRSYGDQETIDRGFSVKSFANHNIHIVFTPKALKDINMALAEFYGDVLPDVDEENPTKAPSTAVAKSLQFYYTPKAVAKKMIADLYDTDCKILEPSCGEGHLLDVLHDAGFHNVIGAEYDFARAAICRLKGYRVANENFLEITPKPTFDYVVMNPPFYGKHYEKHIRHALKFLKPKGKLISVLPATAHYDHGLLKDLRYTWQDLPHASFKEAGTNVPTGILEIFNQ